MAKLKPLNTLQLNAECSVFYSPNSLEELREVLIANVDSEITVLGAGSNVLLAENVTDVIIVPQIHGITIIREDDRQIEIDVCASENWHSLVERSVKSGWYGLENLALIPGTVGAAPIQNIGAYGVDVSQSISLVSGLEVVLQEKNKPAEVRAFALGNEQCHFAYRDSVFKTDAGKKRVITNVRFVLQKQPFVNIDYPALEKRLEDLDDPRPVDVFDAVVEIRRSKLPNPDKVPNVGSFFKNPIVGIEHCKSLLAQYPDIPNFSTTTIEEAGQTGKRKLSAGWLIGQCHQKRSLTSDCGCFQLYEKHALVVVGAINKINSEYYNLESLLAFADKIKRAVAADFGVSLELEPSIIR